MSKRKDSKLQKKGMVGQSGIDSSGKPVNEKPQNQPKMKSGKPVKQKKQAKPAAANGKTAKRTGKNVREKRMSAQESIPYKEMGRDGICRVQDQVYSKTIRFYDINYQLAQNEDKNAIFENWCDFLNYFDSTIWFQFSFINHRSGMAEFESAIRIEPQNDSFDEERMEFAQMLKDQLAKGNNGLVKTKYITFAIEAENLTKAKPRLERIETDILNNFKVLGVQAYPLNGVERLQVMYETFNPESRLPFQFSFGELLRTGLSTKDYIAPESFQFKSGREFMMGATYGAASFLQILAPELTDKMLAEFLDVDKDLIINLHIQSIDQLKAIKLVKSKVTDINRMKIEEQKKAVRSGYDMDIIPSDLNTYGGEAKRLLEDLQSRNERMFLVTVLFLNTGKTKQELDDAVFQMSGIAQKYNCALRRLDYMQEEGLMSSLPLGVNQVPIKRALTTTSTAIFVPFTTQELFMPGESLYYGLNALSNNMIMVDRKKLKNPNGLILGTPGSGKSFAAKREITNAFFVTKDDIIIGDPEGEYYPLVHALGGQVIHLSATSKDYINPMDINMEGNGITAVSENYTDKAEADAVAGKCDGAVAHVDKVERKRKKSQPPKLYDLTTLQREANRIFGYTAQETLQELQKLYEDKLVTYPRTDSQFVTEDMADTVQELLDGLPDMLPFLNGSMEVVDIGRVINNAKVTDHHAILPTKAALGADLSELTAKQHNIFNLIGQRLAQAVAGESVCEETSVLLKCAGYEFQAKGSRMVVDGYKAVENAFAAEVKAGRPAGKSDGEDGKDKNKLPSGIEEDMVIPSVSAKSEQHFTSPPKPYTEDTLLSAMETAGNKEFDAETEKKGLGTPATRASMIEKLVSSGYAVRKGRQIIPTTAGMKLIEILPDCLKSASMTAEWENQLLGIERGKADCVRFMQGITNLISMVLNGCDSIPQEELASFDTREKIGDCPICGKPVYEGKQNFYCSDRSCRFALWKENRYLSGMRKTVDKKMAADMLSKGRTHVKDLYSAKKDTTFEADVLMKMEDGRASFSLYFPKPKGKWKKKK